jgi:hypothetical protein
MGDLNKPMAPSSFYLEFSGICEGEQSVFKNVNIPDYAPKVQGGQQSIGTTKGGKTLWLTLRVLKGCLALTACVLLATIASARAKSSTNGSKDVCPLLMAAKASGSAAKKKVALQLTTAMGMKLPDGSL